ncbi:MAG: hypothetical protein IJA69_01040 [Clostridia bacterium]|nr:hypothetical protein [Clostridia bacterium]
MKIEQQKQEYLSKSKFFKALAKDYKQRLECVNKVANTGMQANGKLRQKETLHLIAGVLGVVGIVAGVVTLNVPVIVLSAGCSIINGAMYADNQKNIKSINGTLAEYEVAIDELQKHIFYLESMADFYWDKHIRLENGEQIWQGKDLEAFAKDLDKEQYEIKENEQAQISEQSEKWIDAANDYVDASER